MNKNSQNLKIYWVTLVWTKWQIILPAECRKDFEIDVWDIFYIWTFKEMAFVMSNDKICSEDSIWKFEEFIENEEQIRVWTKFQFVIPKQIRELLEKHNISKEQLQKISDEGLDKVLTDWKNYSGSSYSKDNMGRLTIEKDEFLR